MQEQTGIQIRLNARKYNNYLLIINKTKKLHLDAWMIILITGLLIAMFVVINAQLAQLLVQIV